MKFVFKPSPNYRSEQSTTGIMMDVTLCLLAVTLFAVVWYGISYGFNYGLRVLLLTICSVVSAEVTEVLYFKAVGKNWKEIFHSYAWVTALIIVLISRINVSYFAIIVATVVAILFGKLLFGGFGANIFNPAAFGAALIMNSFGSSVAADITTGATPMTEASAAAWSWTSDSIGAFIGKFGGLSGLLTGNYASVIGGSCALLLILIFAFLVWQKDIDWHVSVTYVAFIFVVSLIVGLVKGSGIQFALLNVLGGGVMFGAVFMMTDPVTTPATIPGRVVFALGAGALTLMIRWKANLPDGVLFSILLMNMLTPAIDKAFSGSQIKDANKFTKLVGIICAICVVLTLAVGISVKPSEETASVSDTTIEVVENL